MRSAAHYAMRRTRIRLFEGGRPGAASASKKTIAKRAGTRRLSGPAVVIKKSKVRSAAVIMHARDAVDCRDTTAQHGHCNIRSGPRIRHSARTDRVEAVRDAHVMTARKSKDCTLHGHTTCIHSLQCVTETADGMWACAVALDCA